MLLLALLAAIIIPSLARASDLPSRSPAYLAVGGAVPDALRSGTATALRPLPAARPMHLALVLAWRDEAGLRAAAAAMYDRRSTQFQHYLGYAELLHRFGPDPAALGGLRTWLRAQDLSPRHWNGGPIMDVDGDVRQVEAAFQAEIWEYRLGSHTGYAPVRPPMLPAALAALVQSIVGLSEWAVLSRPRIPAAPSAVTRLPRPFHTDAAAQASRLPVAAPAVGHSWADLAQAYDFAPFAAAALHGEGMRAALVELVPYARSDIAAAAARLGIQAPNLTDIAIDGGNSAAGANIEATLDIELLHATAPAAAIDVYNAPDAAAGTGLVDAYSAVASADNVQVLSLQWVNCEPLALTLPGFIGGQHALFLAMKAEGITVVGATGDDGAYACGDDQQPSPSTLAFQPAVNLPASDPFVLAVGATDLTIQAGSRRGIASETAWSCQSALVPACASGFGPYGGGGGGGTSAIFHKGDGYNTDLSWQTGPGVGTMVGGRQIPDVSLSGSFGDPSREEQIFWQGAWRQAGGTSAASPVWAALILLTDQALLQQQLKPLGWVNPLVYQFGAAVQPYPPYHDITAGDNLLYPATPGWDYATGWGSPDAWNFARDAIAYLGGAAPATGTPLFATPGGSPSGTPSPTATATVTATRSATPSPIPTSTPSAARMPQATGTPACGASGIANGTFKAGSLACWRVSGTPIPQTTAMARASHRYSALLTAGPQRKGGSLSQTFTVPSPLRHPVLHISYWLGRSAVKGHVALFAKETYPSLLIADGASHTLIRKVFMPHRERAWSGLTIALPVGGRRLTMSIGMPAQPEGIQLTLLVDEVRLGS